MIKITALFSYLAATAILMVSAGLAAATVPKGYTLETEDAAYSDIADLVVIAPMIIDVKIRKTIKVPAEQSTGVPENMQRLLVEADVLALIRGTDDVASSVRFVVDLQKDSRGRVPKLNKQRLFIMGSAVKGKPGQIQLSRPDALIKYSPANDNWVRMITQEAVKLDAAPQIDGINSAFFSAGTVLGEGETQIFVRTANRQPVSISVLSRVGQTKQWSVSTSELIEETASSPRRFTLLWYRLACGLPSVLPAGKVESGEGENAVRAQSDYKFVIDALGPCGKKR
jgi:hypothetical protein